VGLEEVVSAAVLELPESDDRVLIDVPEDLPLVHVDPGLLRRVFVNVLDNSQRHGGGDEPITVTAHAGAESVKVEIVDHGPGVSESARESLFEPFKRGGAPGDHGQGLGLGLSVARGFVEAMGGAMVADETPGGGLTMRIRLPLDSAQAPVQPTGDAAR
jgi:two-component system sensor histidine kinase KdpD